ncbi:bifunctional diguanylate cyclase/phosphodiesterase [Halopseudomonas pelagia]|uniref:bifunctional diguanylate cyclase/phosphodiesterase n=1 Tax=Halopseudomonas pelagia TaxID=553151 RepID=UPI0003A9C229|nr:bifunctional diguanylate cyclase/phosphodiesterase [Halopseudomonas pelagia]
MTLNEQHQALLSILRQEAVSVLFQPIVSMVQQRIVGYEALSRGPSNSSLHSPLTLFATARQCGLLTELEMLCRRKAVEAFSRMQLPGSLFLNVSPESLLEKQHYPGRTLAMLKASGMTPDQVVIELTEQAPIDNFALLHSALVHYRDMGFRIALDDLGAGYSSLRLWSELRPDFVKIDRHFIDGIHLDPLKREFVGSILSLAKASQAHIIAEGIEQTEELKVLEDMGVDWVQGYWLGRPETEPAACQNALQAHLATRHPEQTLEEDREQALDSLLITVPGVHESETVSQVLARFQQQASLNSLAVINDALEPVGTVHCHSLSQAMLKPFASELHGRKPITLLMDRDYLVVDVQQSLERVSRLLTSRARQRIEEDFIILRDGKYAGLGRVIDVLRHITELKIIQARHANPLTLLPGNIPIQECLARLLANGQEARLCYIDLDAFKPFNDIYGYGKGDEVLLGLAQILRTLCDPRCDFVGHIGGDDFMLVLRSADWRERLHRLDQRFQQLCCAFYRPEHILAGGFSAPDRHGQWRHHGLLQLSVGVLMLPAKGHGIRDPAQLAEMASHAKHEAKRVPGFSVVCENFGPAELDQSTGLTTSQNTSQTVGHVGGSA